LLLGAGCAPDVPADAGDLAAAQPDTHPPDQGLGPATSDLAPDGDLASPADGPRGGGDAADAADLSPAADAADAADGGEADLGPPAGCLPFPAGADVARVRYEPQARPAGLPFPYDYYRQPAAGPTGGRLLFDDEWRSAALLAPIFATFPGYREGLARLDGFGAYAWISMELLGATPPVGWTLTLADSVAPGSPVALHLWDGERITARLAVEATVRALTTREGARRTTLDLLPGTPLPDGARVLVTVSRLLRNAAGGAVGPDQAFAVVAGCAPLPAEPALAALLRGERERLRPAFDALAAAGLARRDLAVAFDFTVGRPREALLHAGRWLQEELPPELPEVALDGTAGGGPAWTRPGDPDFPARIVPGAAVSGLVRGHFWRRDLRDPTVAGGTFVTDATGKPVLHHREPVAFWLALPARPARGPYPLALLVHGINASREQALDLAGPLAAAGIASCAFDLPEHGEDGSGMPAFIRAAEPLAIRDNFRQAALDVLTARLLLRRWAEEGADLLPPGGDGSADLTPGPMVLVGNSLGAMVSLLGLGLADGQPGAAVLAVGGGGLLHWLGDFLQLYLGADALRLEELHALRLLIGQLLAGAEPLLLAEQSRPASVPGLGGARQMLLLEAEHDRIMPHLSMVVAARTLQLPLLQPAVFPRPDFPAQPPGTTDSGWLQLAGAWHDVVYNEGGTEVTLTRATHGTIVRYLTSFLATGEACIEPPDPEGQDASRPSAGP
jgi:hypothetical protein